MQSNSAVNLVNVVLLLKATISLAYNAAVYYRNGEIGNISLPYIVEAFARSEIQCGLLSESFGRGAFLIKSSSNVCRVLPPYLYLNSDGMETGQLELYSKERGLLASHQPLLICPSSRSERIVVITQSLLIIFKTVYEAVPHTEAKSACELSGMKLLKINTTEKWTAVASVLSNCTVFGTGRYWVDGHRSADGWVFDDGTNVPRGHEWTKRIRKINGQCVSILVQYKGIGGKPCEEKRKYICELI